MAELNYVKGLTLNFNLRKPSSKKPTNVYAVVKVCGKQIKFGAKTKCFPDVKQPKTYEKEKCEKME